MGCGQEARVGDHGAWNWVASKASAPRCQHLSGTRERHRQGNGRSWLPSCYGHKGDPQSTQGTWDLPLYLLLISLSLPSKPTEVSASPSQTCTSGAPPYYLEADVTGLSQTVLGTHNFSFWMSGTLPTTWPWPWTKVASRRRSWSIRTVSPPGRQQRDFSAFWDSQHPCALLWWLSP